MCIGNGVRWFQCNRNFPNKQDVLRKTIVAFSKRDNCQFIWFLERIRTNNEKYFIIIFCLKIVTNSEMTEMHFCGMAYENAQTARRIMKDFLNVRYLTLDGS